MNCTELERWLDDGGAPERHVEAMAHARICARCSATLRGMDELEELLAGSPSTPAGFTERVMARVAVTPQVPARIPVTEVLPILPTVPWWVRVALEPASLLAMLLASALVWRGDALYLMATAGAARLATFLAGALTTPLPSPDPGVVGATLVRPPVELAILMALVPLGLMASRVIYRWSSAMIERSR